MKFLSLALNQPAKRSAGGEGGLFHQLYSSWCSLIWNPTVTAPKTRTQASCTPGYSPYFTYTKCSGDDAEPAQTFCSKRQMWHSSTRGNRKMVLTLSRTKTSLLSLILKQSIYNPINYGSAQPFLVYLHKHVQVHVIGPPRTLCHHTWRVVATAVLSLENLWQVPKR